jgi:hypothetical protein
MRRREVRRTQRYTHETQSKPTIPAEQLAQNRIPLRAELVVDQKGRRIGHRRAEANHLLIRLRLVDIDDDA